MNIKLGAKVKTSDGQEVGTIDKLILDPAGGEVKSAVVRKGFILTDDIEIPTGDLQVESDDLALLSISADRLADLPRFNEASYAPPPPDYVPLYGYPTEGVLWPLGGLDRTVLETRSTGEREAEVILRRQDFENAVIDRGSDVKSLEGEKVGELHSLSFDPASHRLVNLVVRKGFLLTEDCEFPAETIADVDDGVVFLRLSKADIEARFSRARR
jgi:uncharacterized protein YrrD